MTALLILMLKTTRLPNKPGLNKNDSSKSVSNKNNDSQVASKSNNGNNEMNGGNMMENAKKLRKLKKLSKAQKLAKSKKLSKSENSSKITTKKVGPNFLTSGAKTTFNRKWLAFNKALIL